MGPHETEMRRQVDERWIPDADYRVFQGGTFARDYCAEITAERDTLRAQLAAARAERDAYKRQCDSLINDVISEAETQMARDERMKLLGAAEALEDIAKDSGIDGGKAYFATVVYREFPDRLTTQIGVVEAADIMQTAAQLRQQAEAREAGEKCPRCGSPDPALHPAMQFEGEVQPCGDHWHKGQAREAAKPSLADQLAAAQAEVAKLAELVKEYLDPEEWKHENRSGWILCSGCGAQLDLGRYHAPDCKWVTRVKQAESPALAWLAARDARMKAMGAAEWLEGAAREGGYYERSSEGMREEAAQLRQQAEAARLAEGE